MSAPIGMILAAGFGTRLRPLTHELPKPLVPVGDRSVLAHAADNLRALGVEHVVINTHHLADAYDEDALRDALDLRVSLRREATLRGTAGGIAGVRDLLGDGPVVVHNGDILATLDTAALYASHQRSGALATLAVRGGLPPGRGSIGLSASGGVARMRDHRFDVEAEGAEFIGVHVLSAALLARLPAVGCIVGDVYVRALERGEGVRAAAVVRGFTDVGTPLAYLEANLAWLRSRGESEHRGDGARIAPTVELEHSIVGALAEVSGRGKLTRCVVWPGAKACAPLRDAIVTPHATLQEITPGTG